MRRRAAGVLLHITSLPSAFGIGDLGYGAYKFADFLAEAQQSYWQILPLNPTSEALGNSPYSSHSAFAGNPLLIAVDLLIEDGILVKAESADAPVFQDAKVDYGAVTLYKDRILRRAYENRKNKLDADYEFGRFCQENTYWLDDYALFVALKQHFNQRVWNQWPNEIRDRNEDAVKAWKERLRDRILMEKFFQYLFFKQWGKLKEYCHRKHIQFIGDIPIYVSYDSPTVWANPHLFKLDEEKYPSVVAGVPPDYFSVTGQLWGNPVYKWDILKGSGFAWWIERIQHNLKYFDIVRVDHFRGFVDYWEVPAGEETAINGQWVDAPARDFFNTLLKHIPMLPVIAEDLGFITPAVREIIHQFDFPTMKLLLFAFGEDLPTHPYAPHNYTPNCVVYTGTHDNNTVRGWFKGEASPEDKQRLSEYIGRSVSEDEIHWELIRLAMMSVANTVIIPIQDLLGLDETARMNLPATPRGNWAWRLQPNQLTPSLIKRLAEITRLYGRT